MEPKNIEQTQPRVDGLGGIGIGGRVTTCELCGAYPQENGHVPGCDVPVVDALFNRKVDLTFTEVERMGRITDAAKHLAITIKLNSPSGPDQSAAIRKVREAAWTAVAGMFVGESGAR